MNKPCKGCKNKMCFCVGQSSTEYDLESLRDYQKCLIFFAEQLNKRIEKYLKEYKDNA